jgi:hypothetical protein
LPALDSRFVMVLYFWVMTLWRFSTAFLNYATNCRSSKHVRYALRLRTVNNESCVNARACAARRFSGRQAMEVFRWNGGQRSGAVHS